MAVWSAEIDKYWNEYYHASCDRKERKFSRFANAISKPIFLVSLKLLRDNSEFKGAELKVEVAKHISTEVLKKYYRLTMAAEPKLIKQPEAFLWNLIRNAIQDARRTYKTENSPFERLEDGHLRMSSHEKDGGAEQLYHEYNSLIVNYLTNKHCPPLTPFEAEALLLRACLGLSTKEIQKDHFRSASAQSIDSAIKRAKKKIRTGGDAGLKGFISNEIK